MLSNNTQYTSFRKDKQYKPRNTRKKKQFLNTFCFCYCCVHGSSYWVRPEVYHFLYQTVASENSGILFFRIFFLQDCTFRENNNKFFYFKASSKTEYDWGFSSLYSDTCSAKGVLPAHRLQTPLSSCTAPNQAAARTIASLNFLLVFLHAFFVVGIFFLSSNGMAFLCYSFGILSS